MLRMTGLSYNWGEKLNIPRSSGSANLTYRVAIGQGILTSQRGENPDQSKGENEGILFEVREI